MGGDPKQRDPALVLRRMKKLTRRRACRMNTVGSTGTTSGLMVELALMTGGHVVLGEKSRLPR